MHELHNYIVNGQTPCSYLPCTLDSTATEQSVTNTDELLPRDPCLQALAALRHAKWFQVCFQFSEIVVHHQRHKRETDEKCELEEEKKKKKLFFFRFRCCSICLFISF